MPLIEELPTTSLARPSYGWAYVPVNDNAPIAALQPGARSDRKARTAHVSNAHRSGTTAKQEKAIQSRLDALNKENHRDGVHVPIPQRPAERDAGRRRGKMTSNVRRVLGYQRGFVHWLGEDEASASNTTTTAHVTAQTMAPPLLSAGGSGTSTPTTAGPAGRKTRTARASAAAAAAASQDTTMVDASPAANSKKARSRAGTRSAAPAADANKSSSPNPTTPVKVEIDTAMPDATDDTSANTTADVKPPLPSAPPYPEIYDKDPLLRTLASEVPPNPTERVIQLLLAEPPLSYSAAAAKPLDQDHRRPVRQFCGVCGYWGRVKCKGCGEWTCGIMECWKSHQAVCLASAY